ncbi:dihydrofolate reductase [Leadbetterella byssophila DSM 17132]|uniref:Dihydrofolate reductase n=1 Tax=Leadbetterella byssophila (strain DSM 17132 / JCM 16389 / KACC 11308 / NBRC 106382 / 4M15) TaxID=649349 RepID=E4RSG7_LEAB4|nr:dihydrofolate reductase [Leadbetterella byssophila]ADQ17703.1 dihydrofolate reductase [Leadbetterella byssophila DSM 17132]
MEIALLVAVAENGVIGKDNQLLWKLRDDLQLFKKRTLGHPIIMGRKTYESIGKPLPGRTNIVISRNAGLKLEGCTVTSSLEEALEVAQNLHPEQEIFVIGGGKIYELATPIATKLYLTKVNVVLEGDTYFDLKPFENWQIVEQISLPKSEHNEYDAEVITLTRS